MTQKAYNSGWLSVGRKHEIFWQEFGNPEGILTLFCHGGPGCGFEDAYLKLFDLSKIRLIAFDQRGCGKSKPLGCLTDNSTADLIEDIEKLRKNLSVPEWFVAGHSWGTSLALLYAGKYKNRVKGLLLTGFFSAQRQEHLWCLTGARSYYPDLYQELVAALALKTDQDVDLEIAQKMESALPEEKAKIVSALSVYFGALISLVPPQRNSKPCSDQSIAMWNVFLHYAKNNFFLDPETGVYPFVEKGLKDMPITLVHGRFDMDCRPAQAFVLKEKLTQLKLVLVAGNHDVEEEPMATAYQQAIIDMTGA